MEPIGYHDAGSALTGGLTRPEGVGNGRAALVLHEADGIGGNVRRRCAMLAALGYVAFAADLHGAGRALAPDEIAPAMARFRDDPAALRRRVRSALAALRDATGLPASAIVAIGYCFGGMAALELARDGAGLAAAVSFHGPLTTAMPATPGAVVAPVLACTGALDPLVPPPDIAAFQTEMTGARADWRLIVYGTALHGFTNPAVDGLGDPRMRYDPAADRQSWTAMLAFLADAHGAREGIA